MSQLPVEIVTDIFNNFSISDSSSLKSCSLVCPSFRDISQRLLFDKVVLSAHDSKALTKFDAVVKQNPLIAEYVQTLELLDVPEQYDSLAPSLILSLLRSLKSVRFLRIRRKTSACTSDLSSDPEFSEALRKVAQSCESLTSVELEGMEIPLEFLSSLPNLQTLRLRNVRICGTLQSAELAAQRSRPHPRSVSVERISQEDLETLFLSTNSVFDLCQTHDLDLRGVSAQSSKQLMAACKSAMEALSIDITSFAKDKSLCTLFSSLTPLASLTIAIDRTNVFSESVSETKMCPVTLCGIIESMPRDSLSTLREMNVMIQFTDMDRYEWPNCWLNALVPVLRTVDSHLGTTTLEVLAVKWKFPYGDKTWCPHESISTVQQVCPQASQKNVLRVEIL